MAMPSAMSQGQGPNESQGNQRTEAEAHLHVKIDDHWPPNLQGILNCLDSTYFSISIAD